MKSAIVVIPSTGSVELVDAVKSVLTQTRTVDCLVVTDGMQFGQNVSACLSLFNSKRLYNLVLPFNTGANGYYGNRIYAAVSHLVTHDYVLFLDQDNWYEPAHCESLIGMCEDQGYDWSYSLRNIVSKEKEFLCQDNCESLGKWEIADSPGNFLIDNSQYCFKLDFLKTVGHAWDFGWGADRRFYFVIKESLQHTNYDCSGLYTMNYRLGGNEGSVRLPYFEHGNMLALQKHNGQFPWSK